jgi:hypothetical protein
MIFVPPVEAEQIRSGLEIFQPAIVAAGSPEPGSNAWEDAYSRTQARLRLEYGRAVGDAILWRVTFLDAWLGWDHFQQLHAGDGELPTPEMLRVAGEIPTSGIDTSFDLEEFEEMLRRKP